MRCADRVRHPTTDGARPPGLLVRLAFASAALAALLAGCRGGPGHPHAEETKIDAVGAVRTALADADAVVQPTRRTAGAACGLYESRGDAGEYVIDVTRGRVFLSAVDPGVDALAAAACTKVAPGAHKGGEGGEGKPKSGGH